MAEEIERIYTIPLRRRYMSVSRWRRAEKAVKVIRQFIQRHMKADEVKIGMELNQFIWQYGGKKAPARAKVRVVAEKEDDKVIARVNLVGVEEKKKKEEKVEKVKLEKKEESKEEKKEETKEKKEKSEKEKGEDE